MSNTSSTGDREQRLNTLREQARGAPPPDVSAGYYGHPLVKPPVWTWEVPLYLFVGGAAGMSSVIALCSIATRSSVPLTRTALWFAAGGALLSPLLLISDLGRPRRFLNMLRVLKWRSPMSVGVWTLVVFTFFSVSSALCLESFRWVGSISIRTLSDLLFFLTLGAGVSGTVLASYTGVLLGATVVPVWNRHRAALPFHFVAASLGAAAGALELVGFREPALGVLGFGTAAVELFVFAGLELQRHGAADRALRRGASGALVRAACILAGPLALTLRATGQRRAAALSFVLGALLSRFGWVAAGRASALDPEAALVTSQRVQK